VLTAQQRATVNLNVIRNENAPFFQRTPYFTTIERNINIGDTVFTVTAFDADFSTSNSVSGNVKIFTFQLLSIYIKSDLL